jgi:hypothetical protein|tara:strand:- start:278 stop:583 length:306 start_codon:yes stop_codon:yes gene_type:complete
MKQMMASLLKHYMNQDIAVFHYDEEGNSEVVAYVSVNKNLSTTKKLEEAFMKTNSISIAWWKNEEVTTTFAGNSCRSTSVGDVVVVDEKKYKCEPVGWKEL